MLDNLPEDATILVKNTGTMPMRCGDYVLHPGSPVPVTLTFLAMYGATPGLEFDFSSLADRMRSRTDDGRPYFDFWSPLSMVDGYGRHAIDIWKGLHALGAEAVLRSSGGRFLHRAYMPDAILAEHRMNMVRPPAKVGVAFTVPYDPKLIGHQSPVKIALTQFETDTVPERHVERVNQCDHLIVTSSFQPKIWKRCGCKVPISVMTPGIDTDFFAYAERPAHPTFNVLLLGALSPRKNADGALRIFQEASEGNPDWRLTIKSRGELAKDVRQLAARDRRIEVVFRDAAPGEVLDLYHAHDCLLWPSRGEGVGLPPLEAMSTGMEVVASFNSGMMDYLTEKNSYSVKASHKVPAGGPGLTWDVDYIKEFGEVGSFWEPDFGHAVKQLRKCFNNWLAGKGKGRAAAEYVRSSHTLRHQAASVLRVVEEYL